MTTVQHPNSHWKLVRLCETGHVDASSSIWLWRSSACVRTQAQETSQQGASAGEKIPLLQHKVSSVTTENDGKRFLSPATFCRSLIPRRQTKNSSKACCMNNCKHVPTKKNKRMDLGLIFHGSYIFGDIRSTYITILNETKKSITDKKKKNEKMIHFKQLIKFLFIFYLYILRRLWPVPGVLYNPLKLHKGKKNKQTQQKQ